MASSPTTEKRLNLIVPAYDLMLDAMRERPMVIDNPQVELRVAYDDYRTARALLKRQPETLPAFVRLMESKDDGRIEIIGRYSYEALMPVAARRVVALHLVPTVAAALSLMVGHGIMSDDGAIVGCGVPVWSLDTVVTELASPIERPAWFPTIGTPLPAYGHFRIRLVPRGR